MEGMVVWRLRAPGLIELVAEVFQVESNLFYRRLVGGAEELRKPLTPEQAGQMFFDLLAQGWQTQ